MLLDEDLFHYYSRSTSVPDYNGMISGQVMECIVKRIWGKLLKEFSIKVDIGCTYLHSSHKKPWSQQYTTAKVRQGKQET